MTTPDKQPILPFELSPLIAKTNTGGVILNESLLTCTTLDTENNESTLDFSVSLSDDKVIDLFPEMDLAFRDRRYRIRTIDYSGGGIGSGRGNSNQATVYAERSWYDLLYSGRIAAIEFDGRTARHCLGVILADTEWAVGIVESDETSHWTMAEATALGGISQVGETYGLQPVFNEHDKEVNLVLNPGRDRGTTFTYDKHVTSANRKVDTTGLITRIYGQNPDGVTISSVNNGLEYLEDYSYSDERRIAYYNFREGIRPSEMKQYLEAYLKLRSAPVITYELEVGGLAGRDHEIERFDIFDTVFIMDNDYASSVYSKIVEMSIDWLNLSNSRITLGSQVQSLSRVADPTNGNAPGRIEIGEQPANKIPASPTVTNVSTGGYWQGERPLSRATVEWSAVSHSLTGESVLIDGYEAMLNTGQIIGTTDTSGVFEGLLPEHSISVKVRAISKGIHGHWSESVSFTPQSPEEIVPVPSGMTLSSESSQVQVRWNGTVLDGGSTVLAFDRVSHIDVEMARSMDGPWDKVGVVRKDQDPLLVLMTPFDSDKTVYFRPQVVDFMGNLSLPGTVQSVTVIDSFLEQVNNDLAEYAREAITGTEVQYAIGDSDQAPTSGWNSDTPENVPGRYVWMRTRVTYGDNRTSLTSPALITGNDGAPGKEGKEGQEGQEGKDGSDGVSVTAITPYFRMVVKNTSAPDRPTVKEPDGWSYTEPMWQRNRSLYRTDRVDFSNGQHSWTSVTRVAAFEAADESLDRLDDLTQQLTGAINGDLEDAVANHTGAVGQVMEKAEEFESWSEENQTDLNNSFALAHDYAAIALGENLLAWQTQDEANRQTDLVLRQHQDQLILHENQLKWSRWTQVVQDFRFSVASGVTVNQGDSFETGLIDVRINSINGRGCEIITRPGWAGTALLETTLVNGGSYSNSLIEYGDRRVAGVTGLHPNDVIRYIEIKIYPYWHFEPREYALAASQGQFRVTEGYRNRLEGNPINGTPDGHIMLAIPVVSSEAVEVSYGGDWLAVESGETINVGAAIRPIPDHEGVVLFTHDQPPLQWEAGAPLSGNQSMTVSRQTVPQTSWRNLGTWTAPMWLAPRNGRISFTVRWDNYNPISSQTYITRIMQDGVEVARLSRASLFGMNIVFTINADTTMNPGGVFTFEAWTTAGLANERLITGGDMQISWY